jgi:hypothetical protein
MCVCVCVNRRCVSLSQGRDAPRKGGVNVYVFVCVCACMWVCMCECVCMCDLYLPIFNWVGVSQCNFSQSWCASGRPCACFDCHTQRIFQSYIIGAMPYVLQCWVGEQMHLTCLGLARTVYTHRIWPYVWWCPCLKCRMYTVYTYKCMDLAHPTHTIADVCNCFTRFRQEAGGSANGSSWDLQLGCLIHV